jgi:DNA-binding CsgD family transcriptional regulator
MLHVLVALYGLGALAGVAAAMFVNHHRLVFGFPFFRPLVRYLLFSSLLMLVILSTYYAAANLPRDGTGRSAARILWEFSNNFVGFIAFSGLLVCFIQVLRGFEGKALTPRSKTLLTVFVAGACCCYGIGFGLTVAGVQEWLLHWSRNLYNLGVPVLMLIAMVGLLRRVWTTTFVIPRSSVRAFLLLYLAGYALALVLPVLFAGAGLLVLALVLLTIHLLPFLWITQFFMRDAAIVGSTAAATVPMDTIAERHRLTGREREIVECLLKGRSNAEIGEALFISVGTVKNHVYNIYRKLGVKSRGQLYRYARESEVDRERPRG